MKIAIVSDIHDHSENLLRAIELSAGTDAMICCGDLCSPFIIFDFGRNYSKPIHIVFGNNDADRFRIANLAREFPQITLHGEYCELEFDGLTFAVNHFDNIGEAIGKGAAFDVVCFGHNHQHSIKRNANCSIINPGEVYGKRTGSATFVIFDTETRKAELCLISS